MFPKDHDGLCFWPGSKEDPNKERHAVHATLLASVGMGAFVQGLHMEWGGIRHRCERHDVRSLGVGRHSALASKHHKSATPSSASCLQRLTPKGPFRTKNAIAMEIIMFCYHHSILLSMPIRCAIFKENSIQTTIAVVNYYRLGKFIAVANYYP